MKWTKPTHYGIDWEHRGKHHDTGHELHPGNSMPFPYRELSLEEYFKLSHCQPWGPTGEGNYRQVLELKGGRWVLHIQHYNDYSLTVAERYDHKGQALDAAIEIDAGHGNSHYLRFFVLGCKHEYKEVTHEFAQKELGVNTWGMHCHVSWCHKCGHHYSVDSSG